MSKDFTTRLFVRTILADDMLKMYGPHRSDMPPTYKADGFVIDPADIAGTVTKNVNYGSFCKPIIETIPTAIFFVGVLTDNPEDIERQAAEIHSWGKWVIPSIPVMNSIGTPLYTPIRRLSLKGIPVNVTKVVTLNQAAIALQAVGSTNHLPTFISFAAGDVANTGLDPEPLVSKVVASSKAFGANTEVLWDGVKENINVIQASNCGCYGVIVKEYVVHELDTFGAPVATLVMRRIKKEMELIRSQGLTL